MRRRVRRPHSSGKRPLARFRGLDGCKDLPPLSWALRGWKRLHRRIIIRLAYFGVAFESDLPPEFVISRHAEDQMRRRMHFRRDKMRKIVVKAWRSKEVSRHARKLKKRSDGRIYRTFHGCTFVFASERVRIKTIRFTRKTLVTVILPGEVVDNGSSQNSTKTVY